MNEDVLLEEVLVLAEQDGYEPAYDFSLAQRGAWKDGEHPQIYYFLACLAAGGPRLRRWSGWPRRWSKRSIGTVPEMLTTGLSRCSGTRGLRRCAKISEGRYEEARRGGRMQLSGRRAAGTLVGGARQRTLNAGIARAGLGAAGACGVRRGNSSPGGGLYGRFRWEYDGENYRQTADAARIMQ